MPNELLDRFDPSIDQLTQAIEQEAERMPEVQQLQTHPGVGPIAALVSSITQRAAGNSSLRDRDVIEALAALVHSFETRVNSGLHYEPTRPSLAQQALIEEFREVVADYDEEGREMGYPNLHDGEALKALVFILRLALDRSSGRPLSRGFLDFLRTEFTKNEGNSPTRILLP